MEALRSLASPSTIIRKTLVALLAVAAVGGAGLSGWLYGEQQDLRAELESVREQVRTVRQEEAERDQGAVNRALLEHVAPRLNELEQGLGGVQQELNNLERALFGLGPSPTTVDVVGELQRELEGLRSELGGLRSCVNQVARGLAAYC